MATWKRMAYEYQKQPHFQPIRGSRFWVTVNLDPSTTSSRPPALINVLDHNALGKLLNIVEFPFVYLYR